MNIIHSDLFSLARSLDEWKNSNCNHDVDSEKIQNSFNPQQKVLSLLSSPDNILYIMRFSQMKNVEWTRKAIWQKGKFITFLYEVSRLSLFYRGR